MNPAAILALMSDLYEQVAGLNRENEALRNEVSELRQAAEQ